MPPQTDHPYQHAFDVITDAGIKVRPGQKPYRVLHKLAKAKGVYMHGSPRFIGKTFSLKPNKVSKMARDALKRFCEEGVLQIPDEFRYNDNNQYRHDGDGDANRNLWKSSNKAATDKDRDAPVHYSYNTTKR